MKKAMILICTLVFLTGTGVAALGGDGKSFIEERYRAGRKYFREGNYDAAIKEFEEVIKMNPNYEVAAEYLKVAKAKSITTAEKKISLEERKEGFKEVDKKKEKAKSKRESDLAKVKEGYGRWVAKEREKKRVRVEKKKEQAILKREKELAHYYGIDELEDISQDAQKMIGEAEKRKILQEQKENEMWAKLESLPSPQKEKSMADIYMGRADAAYKDENYDKAIIEWEKVSALDPTNHAAKQCIERVRQMIERDRQTELEKARAESIAEAKEAGRKYSDRGKYLYQHKDYNGSIEVFQKAIAIDPGSKPAQAGLLKARRALTSLNLKEERARRKRTQEVYNLVEKGNRYFQKNQFLKAKKLAMDALQLDPNSKEAKTLLENSKEKLIAK